MTRRDFSMRILIIGSKNDWRMEAAVERALRREGHETLLIDDRRHKRLFGWSLTQRWALRQRKKFRPDFVFLSKCRALAAETVAEIISGVQNAMWYHDALWYNDPARPDIAHILKIGRVARTFFVTGFEKEWARHGVNAKWLPSAGNSQIRPVPRDERFASDIAFIGAGYDPDRARLLVEVARHFDLRVWGPGWEEWKGKLNWTGRSVERNEFAAVCSSTKIMLGINPTKGSGGSFISDRLWMVMLAGAFHLGQRSRPIDELLIEGRHVAWYDDVTSCIEKCEYYLAHSAERDEIRLEGERYVRANHTYDQRIINVLEDREFSLPSQVVEATKSRGRER
jgi:hypothetical protein